MALERVPPPPPEPPEDEYRSPGRSPWKWLAPIVAVAVIGGIWLAGHTTGEPPAKAPVVEKRTGPFIEFQPSLVVPGPAQVPHQAKDGDEARPDEVFMFRVNMAPKGYLLLGLETEDGRLVRIRGGRPDDEPMEGSHLVYEDGKALAVGLEPHKGKKVTFVAALSSKPWDPIPERLPSSPRRYPDPAGAKGTPPDPSILAWDRFTVSVMSEVPVYPTPH